MRKASRRRSSRSIRSGPSRCRITGSPARPSGSRWMRRTTSGPSIGPTPSRTTSRPPTSWSAMPEAETTRRSRARGRLAAAASPTPIGKCCKVAPPVLVYDQAGNLVKSWGGPGQGLRLAGQQSRHHRRPPGQRLAGRQRRQGHADPEVQRRREVPLPDRQARRPQRQQRHRELLAADEDLGRRFGQRDVHRRRLRQPPRDRARRRHRQVQAALGRLRQQAERRTDARVQSQGPAVEAVQHRALRDRLERRASSTSAIGSTIAFRSSARTARS